MSFSLSPLNLWIHFKCLNMLLFLSPSFILWNRTNFSQLKDERDRLRVNVTEANLRADLLAQEVDDHHHQLEQSSHNKIAWVSIFVRENSFHFFMYTRIKRPFNHPSEFQSQSNVLVSGQKRISHNRILSSILYIVLYLFRFYPVSYPLSFSFFFNTTHIQGPWEEIPGPGSMSGRRPDPWEGIYGLQMGAVEKRLWKRQGNSCEPRNRTKETTRAHGKGIVEKMALGKRLFLVFLLSAFCFTFRISVYVSVLTRKVISLSLKFSFKKRFCQRVRLKKSILICILIWSIFQCPFKNWNSGLDFQRTHSITNSKRVPLFSLCLSNVTHSSICFPSQENKRLEMEVQELSSRVVEVEKCNGLLQSKLQQEQDVFKQKVSDWLLSCHSLRKCSRHLFACRHADNLKTKADSCLLRVPILHVILFSCKKPDRGCRVHANSSQWTTVQVSRYGIGGSQTSNKGKETPSIEYQSGYNSAVTMLELTWTFSFMAKKDKSR